MPNEEIGNRIKYARDLRGATLDDIAKKVGVAKSTIQRYENGKINTIKIPVIESIAGALGVNPAWIVGKSNEMELPSQKIPKIIQYYESLNNLGKETATEQVRLLTLDEKYTKVTSIVKEPDADYLNPNAAHERTGVEIKEDERLDDENMLD
jgi:transcriptional regulator with XRE-family HTH domain